jgi:hypothetical protein
MEFRVDTIEFVTSLSGPATYLGFSSGHEPSAIGLAA